MAFVLILSACASGGSSSGDSGEKPAKKTLRIVNDAQYAPFEYMDKGKMVGFDVDIMKALAKEAGYKYKLVNVGWDPLFVELKNKTADMSISAITINADRKQSYDFSNAYFLSTNKILIPKDSDIKSGADLKGKTIAVQTATTGQEAVEKIVGKNNPKVKKYKNINLAIMELNNGGADAVVADNTVIEQYAKNNADKNLKVVEDADAFEPEFYGMMYPKDSKLKPEFDKALNALFDNGTYAKIYKKWFKVEPDIDQLKAQQ
jgi:polar amino acid transport system substrate-binding protein